MVGEGIDRGEVSGDDRLDRVADGLWDVLDVRDALDPGDHVAALGHAGLVDGDRAVDAVLGGHLLAGLKHRDILHEHLEHT